MRLSELTRDLKVDFVGSDPDISGLAIDSRSLRPGDAFFALRGTAANGADFVGDAVARGAAAVLSEAPLACGDAVNVVVPDAAKALALAAAAFNSYPADELTLHGVTGTNGKTSTAHILKRLLNGAGRRVGVVGTIGYGVDAMTKTTHTTPDAITLHKLFRDFVDDECFGVVMEVSSHAVRQHRTWGLEFELGILTTVTHDHLDYHNDIEDYRAAKADFCRSLIDENRKKPAGTLVYWQDDPVARRIGEAHRGARVTVGTQADADVYVESVEMTLSSTRLQLRLQSGAVVLARMKLLGTFVAPNAALAAAAAEVAGLGPEQIREGLESVGNIPGRFEALGGCEHPVVIVDYSHTPDSMDKVLSTCRSLKPGALFTVFGCGGDRDRSKRPEMGRVAQALSDVVYVTMDNPRTEPLNVIIDEILAGMQGRDNVVVEPDRSTAIAAAINRADCGDVVAVLGKGHEDYQIVGHEKTFFDDRIEVTKVLNTWSAK